MADEDATDRKDIERRVYNLPANLLVRLRAYQVSQGLSSETEAAKRLLDFALQMRDSTEDIIKSLEAGYSEEKDLRVLASEILTRHPLVTEINFSDGDLWFRLQNRERGRISKKGKVQFGDAENSDDYWTNIVDKPPAYTPRKPKGGASPPWEPPGDDLDDEIPF